jgi:hypothetical protein
MASSIRTTMSTSRVIRGRPRTASAVAPTRAYGSARLQRSIGPTIDWWTVGTRRTIDRRSRRTIEAADDERREALSRLRRPQRTSRSRSAFATACDFEWTWSFS